MVRLPWRRQFRKPQQADPAAAPEGEARDRGLTVPSPSSAGAQSLPGASGPYAPLYAFDNPIWYSTPQPPQRRPGSVVTLQTLRQMAEQYDVLRACIQHLKRELAAVPIDIDARPGQRAKRSRVEAARSFFATPGGLGGAGRRRSHFESEIVEDLSIVGAAAVYYQRSDVGRSPRLREAIAIDAATIRPRVDAFGWPGPTEEVYEQWIWGMKVAGFTREALSYDGLYPRSYTPYFASPVEWLVNAVNAALRADDWNRRWLTDGNMPGAVWATPESWTPRMIEEYAAYWEAALAGDSTARQRLRIVPAGVQEVVGHSRKDQDFQEFEMWLLRRTCGLMGVQPASIGFTGEQYKVTQQESMESTSAFGAGVLLEFRKALYDDILERLGFGELCCLNREIREEKAAARAQRNQMLVSSGIKTINEARKEEGLPEVAGGEHPLVPGASRRLDAPGAGGCSVPVRGSARVQVAACPASHRRVGRSGRVPAASWPPPAVGSGFCLVRHAPTKLNAEGLVRGWLDPGLSREGRRVARRLGRYFSGLQIGAIETSDLKRAVRTAEAIAAATGSPLRQADPALRPWNLGALEGLPSAQADGFILEYAAERPAAAPPSGESFRAFAGRFLRGMRDRMESSTGDRTESVRREERPPDVLVTHRRCMALLAAWLKAGAKPDVLDLPTFFGLEIPPGSVMWIYCTETGWRYALACASAERAEGPGDTSHGDARGRAEHSAGDAGHQFRGQHPSGGPEAGGSGGRRA